MINDDNVRLSQALIKNDQIILKFNYIQQNQIQMFSKNNEQESTSLEFGQEQSPKSSSKSQWLHLSQEAIEALQMLKKLKLQIPNSNSNSESKSSASLISNIQLHYINHKITQVKNPISTVAPYKVNFIRSVLQKQNSPPKKITRKINSPDKYRTPKSISQRYLLPFKSLTTQPGKFISKSALNIFDKDQPKSTFLTQENTSLFKKLNFQNDNKKYSSSQQKGMTERQINKQNQQFNTQISTQRREKYTSVEKQSQTLIKKRDNLLLKRQQIDQLISDLNLKIDQLNQLSSSKNEKQFLELKQRTIQKPSDKKSQIRSKEKTQTISRNRSLFELASLQQEKQLITEKENQSKIAEQQMKECTFKPKIQSKGQLNSAQERQKRWLEERTKKINQRLQLQEEKEMKECSFAPKKQNNKFQQAQKAIMRKSKSNLNSQVNTQSKTNKLRTPSPIKQLRIVGNQEGSEKNCHFGAFDNSLQTKGSQQVYIYELILAQQSQQYLFSFEKDLNVQEFLPISGKKLFEKSDMNMNKIESKYQNLMEVYGQLKQIIYPQESNIQ